MTISIIWAIIVFEEIDLCVYIDQYLFGSTLPEFYHKLLGSSRLKQISSEAIKANIVITDFCPNRRYARAMVLQGFGDKGALVRCPAKGRVGVIPYRTPPSGSLG